MLLWIFVLVAAATADLIGYDYDGGEYWWGGPSHGCRQTLSPGVVNVQCALPAGNSTLQTDRSGLWLVVTCEPNSSFSCEQLQEAKPFIDDYTTGVTPGRQISSLIVKDCALPPESLACTLGLLRGGDVDMIRLDNVRGALTPQHVEGLKGVTRFRWYGVDDNITQIPYEVLYKLPLLRSFSMKGGSVEIKESLEESHQSLPELRTLELAESDLRKIPGGAFSNMPGLENLMLWGNKIESIDVDAFEGLSKLVNVSLNSNRLPSLPPGLFRQSPLVALVDLYDNKLEDLSADVFRGLDGLKKVVIFNNKAVLKLGNGTFSNLPALQHLVLESSSIEEIPEDLVSNSTSIKNISLAGNKLKRIPAKLFKNQRLKSLKLNRNSLFELPLELLATQTELETLDLSRNSLDGFVDGLFSDLGGLKKLDLGYNLLETLNRTVFLGMSNLRELSLDGNRIKTLHSATFEVITSLQKLSIARNNMTISPKRNTNKRIPLPNYNIDGGRVPDDVTILYFSFLESLKDLRQLDLSYNDVSIICEDWRAMYSLEKMDLSYNKFTVLTKIDMQFPSNVEVDLQHNSITSFTPYEYTEQTDIPTFILDHNPFVCDCALYDFVSIYESGRKIIRTKLSLDEAICSEPANLKNRFLTELKPDVLTCPVDKCPVNCTCLERTYTSRFELICQNLPNTFPVPPEGVTTQIRLNGFADLTNLPNHVQFVNMSGLSLTIPPNVNKSVEIDLSNNKISDVPLILLERNCYLYLSGNPIDCSCSKRNDFIYTKRNRKLIKDFRYMNCSDGVLVSSINPDQLCTARNAAIIGYSVASFGLFLAVLTAILYKYHTEIRIILRKYGLWWGKDIDDEKMYDAFVSFAHQDEKFVVEQLMPNLEKGRRPLKLCIHSRDWVLGDYIPSQIARSVEQSRWTIIVLSKHFVNSVWGNMEFKAAHGKERVIILMLDDLSADKSLDPTLKAYIYLNTYVKPDDPLVWERLKEKVLSKRRNLGEIKVVHDKLVANALNVCLNEDGKLVNNAIVTPPVIRENAF